MEKHLSRRAAIGIGATFAGAVLELALHRNRPSTPIPTSTFLPPETVLPTIEPTLAVRTRMTTATPIATKTDLPAPETLPTVTPTAERWYIPTVEMRQSFLSDPETFTHPPGGLMLTPQFDDAQWTRLQDRTYMLTCDYKGNGCGVSVIATIEKMMGYFQHGAVPDITSADVVNFLMDKTYKHYKILWPNNIEMEDDPVKWAIDLYGQLGSYSTVQLTTDWGPDQNHVIPQSEWNDLFAAAQQRVLAKGGVLVARVWKHGSPHFIIISGMTGNGIATILDSIGPIQENQRKGNASAISLQDFLQRGPMGNQVTPPLLFSLLGVIPNF